MAAGSQLKRNKLAQLAEKFLPSGRIVDVGCGRGTQLMGLFDGRFEPYGVEISAALARHANEVFAGHGGHCVQNNAIDGLRAFTGVIMRSFLAHEVAPGDACRAALHALKPGGVLIVKVPNFDSLNRKVRGNNWCGFRYPDHVNYFTPAGLAELVTRSGFGIARFNLLDRFPTSDNMWMVARKSS